MTPTEAAARLGVSYDFVLDEIRSGRLRAVRLRAYHIEPADIEAWLNARADAQTEARAKAARKRAPSAGRITRRRPLPKLPLLPTGVTR